MVVAVHSGSFHPDDVFAVALLSIFFKGRIKVIRTREEKKYSAANFVLDVGGEYDPQRNRFDHHQVGGAGFRENRIPYSAFGLLWKEYGKRICESDEVAEVLDKKLVVVIDADDHNVNICKNTFTDVAPFLLTDIIYSMGPSWREREVNVDKLFMKAVDFAKGIILREIQVAKDRIEIIKVIRDYYEKSSDKKIIVVDEPKVSRFEILEALQNFPEPLFVVYGSNNSWAVLAIRVSKNDLTSRKPLPKSWGGLRDDDFVKASGLEDAVFCHKGLFLAGAKSKEGAIKLAKLALQEE